MKPALRFLLTALLLPMAGAIHAQPSDGGFVLSSRDGGFTVTLPPGFGRPERQSETTQSETGPVATTTYTSGTEEGVCLVSFSVYSKKLFEVSNAELMLDAARDGALENVDGGVEKQEDFTLQGHHARTIYFSAMSEGQQLYSRFDWIIAEPCLYQVAYVAFNREDLDRQKIQDYFTSFMLTERQTKAKGKKKR